jgi:hypothetical protein
MAYEALAAGALKEVPLGRISLIFWDPNRAFQFFADTIIGLYAWLFRLTALKKLKPVGIADLTAQPVSADIPHRPR